MLTLWGCFDWVSAQPACLEHVSQRMSGGVKLSSMYTITSFCLQKVVRKHFGLFCLQKFKVKKKSFLYVFVDLTSATLSETRKQNVFSISENIPSWPLMLSFTSFKFIVGALLLLTLLVFIVVDVTALSIELLRRLIDWQLVRWVICWLAKMLFCFGNDEMRFAVY